MMTAVSGGTGWGTVLVVSVVAAVLLVAAVGLCVALRQPTRPVLSPSERPAIGVLEERLARGEIGIEEFEQRLFALRMY
jgi:uncharacterized membrane protein